MAWFFTDKYNCSLISTRTWLSWFDIDGSLLSPIRRKSSELINIQFLYLIYLSFDRLHMFLHADSQGVFNSRNSGSTSTCFVFNVYIWAKKKKDLNYKEEKLIWRFQYIFCITSKAILNPRLTCDMDVVFPLF